MFDGLLRHVSAEICSVFVVFNRHLNWLLIFIEDTDIQFSISSFARVDNKFNWFVDHRIFRESFSVGSYLTTYNHRLLQVKKKTVSIKFLKFKFPNFQANCDWYTEISRVSPMPESHCNGNFLDSQTYLILSGSCHRHSICIQHSHFLHLWFLFTYVTVYLWPTRCVKSCRDE